MFDLEVPRLFDFITLKRTMLYPINTWAMTTLQHIHGCLVKLGHYKLRGIINYPPAHLTALIEEYRVEDLMIGIWGKSLVRIDTRRELIRAYFLLLRHTNALESSGSDADLFYARGTFATVREQLIKAIELLEEDILYNGGIVERLQDMDVQDFP